MVWVIRTNWYNFLFLTLKNSYSELMRRLSFTEVFSRLFIPFVTVGHPQTCPNLLMFILILVCFLLSLSILLLSQSCRMVCSCCLPSLLVLSGSCAAGEIANAAVLRDPEHQTMFYTASHSLAAWLDMMLVPYLHADTHWTLIEIHCWRTCVEFQAAFLAVL